MSHQITVQEWGLIPYKSAWEKQEVIFNALIAHKMDPANNPSAQQVLAFCEHPHVFTLGKSGDPAHLLIEPAQLMEMYEAEFYHNNRGGDITYHGPGQVVGYPLLDLANFSTDLHLYMRNLEEVIIRTLAEYGLEGHRLKGATGVWLDPDDPVKARKICAMGVKTSRWVTMHGFAINVNTDLKYFDLIIPCGIAGKGVTSLQRELGRVVSPDEVKKKIVAYFGEVFDAEMLC
jgi:lipoyl(octanoyl) transferase